jgi:hypothetical protein
LPAIERFPAHYDEVGIQGLMAHLQLRQMIAMQHWLGHPEYTMLDAIQAIQKGTGRENR